MPRINLLDHEEDSFLDYRTIPVGVRNLSLTVLVGGPEKEKELSSQITAKLRSSMWSNDRSRSGKVGDGVVVITG